ncbi:LysR family transcriptional regulator [Psychrosphaera haliotis]|uniref:LysR family transcriptional regulator n=1 Tax=Psychrosphaera haliotis TaxID=555083 RepID=A0A6N8FE63_9GAMM|nr:LysR family transcriptional regulator [Psychrosphaera haliotis]MUH72962.1 LysR family transcriptional regulator [Psychrosphaera haliotis]
MLHSKIDLNLFIVLRAVYTEGSITAAATKLHLTQPAVSHAMARLRDRFNDPLFIRHGRKMVPSAYCQNIFPQIEKALTALNSTLMPQSDFDIRNHSRNIKFGFRDILESIFFPDLITDLVTNTPKITVHSRQTSRVEMEHALEQGELDIVIDVLTPTSENIHHELVCNESFSLICRQDHPILKKPTLEQYVEAKHVLVTLKDSAVDLVDITLAKLGTRRNIVLQCEHFFAATSVISRCDMLLTMPNAYANILKEKMPVCVVPLPFSVPVLPVHMYWHKQSDHDLVNRWMRDKLFAIAEQLDLPR